MDTDKNVASFQNPTVIHPDRFDGTNFTYWKGKLFFLLSVLNIAYMLDTDLDQISKPTNDEP